MALAGIGVLVAGVLATACGGSPASSTAARSHSMLAAELAYSWCMRAHGAPGFPDPNPQAGGFVSSAGSKSSSWNPNSPQFQAAQKACAYLNP